MPNFEITVLKELQNYRWVNSYQVNASDLEQARIVGNAIVAAEAELHATLVNFVQMKASALPNPTRQDFLTVPLNGTGRQALTIADLMGPQIVLFGTFGAGRGRPGRKFYRYALGEENVITAGEGLVFTDAATETAYVNRIAAVNAAVTNAGSNLTIGGTYKPVTGPFGAGIAYLDTRHGWYNRSPATGTTAGAGL